MEGTLSVLFYRTERLDREELIDPTLSICAEQGLSSETQTPLNPREITVDDENRVTVYDDTRQVRLNFDIDSWSGPVGSVLTISTDAEGLVSAEESLDTEYTGFARDLVETIRRLTVEIDPYYVSSYNTWVMNGETAPTPEAVLPLETPFEIERLPWLGVYSEPLIERFGGRERVLATPAWKVEELDNGSILVITTRTPWEGYHEKLPADRYLLDGADRDRATGTDEQTPLTDPFAELESGEFGADVCVHRDDIASEFVDEDLRLERVYVDEARDLRRTDVDTFVRNVVDDAAGETADIVGRMLADLPADATRDDQMVSSLLHGAIPPSFVRLDDPNDENVVTKVMDLDVDTSKHDLLVSLGRVAQQADFTNADLATMERALDNLQDLDDVDGIDDWIEDALL
ncbi:hypothetical protein SAMN05216559_1912 [Halomicrobium zhouii]|uniref:Uncharacterized protein n=2 Tax=Halomicrobium zhouii TaxID=767519 RepID=A0A1I6L2T6_9EURY|nr:hypothetical protein SAMN05216559_1912 [Halomicrobium zhouii]